MYSLNKLESYSRISTLGPVGHYTSHFKRAVCISCRPCVEVHKGEGGPAHVDACGQGEGGQNPDFCGRHKWIAPNSLLPSACGPGTMCLLSASFLRHFSLAVAGLRALLSRFLERALYKNPE